MKKAAFAITALLLTSGAVFAQTGLAKTYTHPTIPSREVLDRLNLKEEWHAYVPMDGKRDGMVSVQLAGKDIFVLTRGGLVVCLDSKTGQTRWRTGLGQPYNASEQLTYNSQYVFAVNGTNLYAINRANGKTVWEADMPRGVGSPPVADEEQFYFALGEKVQAYLLPKIDSAPTPPADKKGDKAPGDDRMPGGNAEKVRGAVQTEPGVTPRGPNLYTKTNVNVSSIGALSSARASAQTVREGPQPVLLFEFRAENPIDLPPVLTSELLILPGSNGTIAFMSKFVNKEFKTFRTGGAILAPGAQYGDLVYIPTGDNNVVALDVNSAKLLWRFTASGTILRKPEVTDTHVYVVADRNGMTQIDRLTGETVWHNNSADRFLSANPKFVYAMDRSGRLLVLDRKRGTELSRYDTRDFVVPISNDSTDRFYLAANDGTILCLRDRDYAKPITTKNPNGKPGKPPMDMPPKDGDKPKEGDKPKDEAPKIGG